MAVHNGFDSVIDSVFENKGGTFYLSLIRGGKLILGDAEFKDGYFVAIDGKEEVIREPFNLDKFIVAEYIADNLSELQKSDQYLGFWIADSGRIYLDVVKHVENREAAIIMGEANGQLAIFDIAAGEEINLSHNSWCDCGKHGKS